MKLSIIMPVYNEKRYFKTIIERILEVKLPIEREIIIIESNSTDGTKEIVKEYRNHKDIKIFYQKRPQGKGSAVKLGIKRSSGEIILIQDADLEYDPKDYIKLIEPILKKEYKFVIGSRKMGQNTWAIRNMETNIGIAIFINIIANLADAFFNIIYNVRLTDPQSMYKVFLRDCLKGIKFESNYFNLDWEIVAKFIRKGYIPLELPIHYESRGFHDGKKVRFLRDIYLNVYAIFKYRFVKL